MARYCRSALGSPLGLLLGLGIGTLLMILSVAAMGIIQGYPFAMHSPSGFTLLQWPRQQIRPACLEETFIRGGTVHFLASFFGLGWAYLGSSVPFALIHFLTRRFNCDFLVCVSSAGLRLSTVYLEHGLLAAIGVHYAWNVLQRLFLEILRWPELGGTSSALESEWTTTLVMLIATIAIVTRSRRRKAAGQRHCTSVGEPSETTTPVTAISPQE